MTYNASIQALIDQNLVPPAILALPVDRRGYPVPWFVAQVEGEWDFRVIRPQGIEAACKRKTCWVCGKPLGDALAFTIGPMCVVNRVTAEPPEHLGCARFACIACPFLTNPRMRRNDKDLPEEAKDPAGIMIDRNPGATAIYVTTRYRRREGLFCLGEPRRVEWWAKGRPATRPEVETSIQTGMPLLRSQCDKEPDDERQIAAHHLLTSMYLKALRLLPPQ